MAAAWTLGVAHPPGYPTFTLLTHLAGRLTASDPALGMNALSAILGGLTVTVVALVAAGIARASTVAGAVRARPVEPLPAAGRSPATTLAAAAAGLLLAVGPAFWLYSTGAEVFPLANLLAAAVLGLMLAWQRDPSRFARLWAAALVAGLAMTNQQTIVLFAPALFLLLGSGWRRLAASVRKAETGGLLVKVFVVPVVLFAVGLVPYLYLPLAASGDPAVNWGDPDTVGEFLAVVSRSAYGTFSFTVREASGSPLEHLALFGEYLWVSFTPVGLGLAVAGLVALARRTAAAAWALGLAVVVAGPVFVVFANPPLDDPITRGVLERFYLLPSLPVAVLAGVGAAAIPGWIGAVRSLRARLGEAGEARARRGGLVAVAVAVGLVVIVGAAVRYPEVDRSGDRTAEQYARDLLEPLHPDALLLMRSDENYTAVVFAQTVLGVRPDVVALDVELLKLATYVSQQRRLHPEIEIPWPRYTEAGDGSIVPLISANLDDRPVYRIGAFREGLGVAFDEVGFGLVDRVLPLGTGEPGDALEGAEAYFDLEPPDRPWPVTTWEHAIAANYAAAAFDLGVALHRPGEIPEADLVTRLYRESIRLAPEQASAWKNLGLLLRDNGGSIDEVVALWDHYLEIAPDDPEAAAIRAEVETLRPR
jgi:hypothetical protein